MNGHGTARRLVGRTGGYAGPLVAAGVSLCAGVLLAVGLLVFQPVPRLKETPQETGVGGGAVYFIEGRRDPAHRRIAADKVESLLRGQAVEFREEDLNALVESAFGALSKARPAGLAKLAAPNVRVRAGAVQIAAELTVELLGFESRVLVQARGAVRQQAGQWGFAPAQMSVGALPLERIPGAMAWIRQRWLEPERLRPEWARAWTQIGQVKVEGDVVRVSLR